MLAKWKLPGALLLLCAFLMFPEDCLAAALEAMRLWATSFAPALFPFFVIAPALTCAESRAVFERLLGKPLRFLLGIDGGAAGAVIVGCLAGSPAGAIALGETPGLSRAVATRAAILASGVSPAFLLTYVGTKLLGSATDGGILLRGQYLSLLLTGILLRGAWREDAPQALASDRNAFAPRPVRDACLHMLTVCGYMVFFGVLACLLACGMGQTRIYPFVSPLLEITNGVSALAGLAPAWWRLPLIAAFYALGGLSILLQNMAKLPGLSIRRFLAGKSVQASLAFAITCLLQRAPAGIAVAPQAFLVLGAVVVWIVCALARRQKIGRGAEETHAAPRVCF